MPTFLHFSKYYDSIVNASHIISLRKDSRLAVQEDVAKGGMRLEEGQVIFSIHIAIVSQETWLLYFNSKEEQEAAYTEIMAALKPVTIGKIKE